MPTPVHRRRPRTQSPTHEQGQVAIIASRIYEEHGSKHEAVRRAIVVARQGNVRAAARQLVAACTGNPRLARDLALAATRRDINLSGSGGPGPDNIEAAMMRLVQ